jgi:hypothetical protein
MGLLDLFNRWRKPAKSAMVTVPPGHELYIYSAGPIPALVCAEGGVVLAHLGTSSDHAACELEAMCVEVEVALRAPAREVRMSTGSSDLRGFFAQKEPQWVSRSGVLLWTIHRDCLIDWARDPARMRWLLYKLHLIGESLDPGLLRVLFVAGLRPEDDRELAQFIASFDIRVFTSAPDLTVLWEVLCPDGRRLSSFVGEGFSSTANKSDMLAGLRRETDPNRRNSLVDAECERLAQRLAQAPREAPRRAPRMRRALLAVEGGDRRPMLAELRARVAPLALLVEPDGRGALAEWPGLGPALPVFSDLDSLFLTAEQTGRSDRFAAASMSVEALCTWALKQQFTVLLNTFRTPDEPVYFRLLPHELKQLAERR